MDSSLFEELRAQVVKEEEIRSAERQFLWASAMAFCQQAERRFGSDNVAVGMIDPNGNFVQGKQSIDKDGVLHFAVSILFKADNDQVILPVAVPLSASLLTSDGGILFRSLDTGDGRELPAMPKPVDFDPLFALFDVPVRKAVQQYLAR